MDYSQDELKRIYDLGYKEFFLEKTPTTKVKETTTITNKDILDTNDTN